MRFLIVSQYFAPEMTAAPLRLRPLAAGLAARGHDVEVICEVPSHPQGVRYPGFAPRPLQRRQMDGFEVSYVWAATARSKRPLRRLFAYGSYAASGTLRGALTRRPAVVFASSPPLSVGLVGEAVAARHRVPWVFDVRDLWPMVAEELGSVRSRRVIGVATGVERHLYRAAAGVTVATAAFKEHVTKTIEAERVLVLPNGTTREWLQTGAEPADRVAADLPDDTFVWTFAGNVGLSQGLDAAVEAARLLGPGFRLLILGDGASRLQLEGQAASAIPGTIEFRDPVPADRAAQVMRASDALLVSLSDHAALGKTMPVKFYDSAALGRPLLIAAPGEPRRVALETGAGLTSAPGDAAELAAAVRRLRDEEGLGEKLAAAARDFAAASLREDQVAPLEAFLMRATAGSRLSA